MFKVGIAIPYYNDAKIIPKTIQSLISLDQILSQMVETTYLFWDDGSNQVESKILLESISKIEYSYPKIVVKRSETNRGYGYATNEIRNFFASTDLCVLLDSELSMLPEDVLTIVSKFLSDQKQATKDGKLANGVIYKPSRFQNLDGLEDLHGVRRFWTTSGNFFARATIGGGIQDPTNGFRALDKNALRILTKVKMREDGFASIVEEIYHARRKGINFITTSQTYVSRKADSRPTSFIYSSSVIRSYMRYCLLICIFRMVGFRD
jgi:glycosyltransferase involved in cell wall biosynthesis